MPGRDSTVFRTPSGGPGEAQGFCLKRAPRNGPDPRALALAQHMPAVRSHPEAGPYIRPTRLMQGVNREWSL
jgi:hypothetical protein